MPVAPRPVRQRVAPVANLLFAAFAVGCATITRPPVTVAALQQDAVRIEAAQSALRDTVIERLVRRAVRRGDRTIDVLMLSGGGQNGSFGVGFLRGWKQRATEPMPEFDLVTGVSTGALQAPYALLGTRAALDTITALYARAASSFAPSLDWWFWLRRTGGLVNTRSCRSRIAVPSPSAMSWSIEMRNMSPLLPCFRRMSEMVEVRITSAAWRKGRRVSMEPPAHMRRGCGMGGRNTPLSSAPSGPVSSVSGVGGATPK